MLNEKMQQISKLKLRIMDAIANISTITTPAIPTMPSQTVPGSSVQQANPTNDSSILPSSSAPHSTLHNPTVPALQPLKSRLPKITLPKFKGEVTQFRSFWDSFESTVHSNTGLTKIDKFNYLVPLLEGTVSHAIPGLPITEEHYDTAVNIINN